MKKGLGKGLDTLFSGIDTAVSDNPKSEGIIELNVNSIEPNKKQPRKNFDEEKLKLLADSITENGLISPIIVVKKGENKYTIVAGERRWRAAKIAKIKKIPAIIKDYSDKTIAEIALIENLQREDLNPIEEALGYKELCSAYKMTQEEISEKVGKSRSAIANSMRLLNLEEDLQQYLISGQISEGHARVALSLESFAVREFFIKEIIKNGLNVRQAEKLAKHIQSGKTVKSIKKISATDIELQKIENSLSEILGTKVLIKNGSKKGKLEIEYYGNDDLDRIIKLIGKN